MALASSKTKLNILFKDKEGGNDFVYVFDNKDLDSEAKKLFEGLVKKYNTMSKNDDLKGFDSDKKQQLICLFMVKDKIERYQ